MEGKSKSKTAKGRKAAGGMPQKQQAKRQAKMPNSKLHGD